MATEKRLIEKLRRLADLTPPICQYDQPEDHEIFGKKITVYCKPFEQFQEVLRSAADALSADAVEVVRCKDCENTCPGSNGLVCTIWGAGTEPDAFCSNGERKDNV